MALGKTIFSLYTWWLPEVHPWPSAQNNHRFYSDLLILEMQQVKVSSLIAHTFNSGFLSAGYKYTFSKQPCKVKARWAKQEKQICECSVIAVSGCKYINP